MSDVSYVINFDAPNTPEAYTHRIGRTGRSEQAGCARTLVGHEDSAWITATEKYLKASIPRHELAGFTPPPRREKHVTASGTGAWGRPVTDRKRRRSGNQRSRRAS